MLAGMAYAWKEDGGMKFYMKNLTLERINKNCSRAAGLENGSGSGLFGFGLRFASVTAPWEGMLLRPSLAQGQKSSLRAGYSFSLSALAVLILIVGCVTGSDNVTGTIRSAGPRNEASVHDAMPDNSNHWGNSIHLTSRHPLASRMNGGLNEN
jgi:hypothetical protein